MPGSMVDQYRRVLHDPALDQQWMVYHRSRDIHLRNQLVQAYTPLLEYHAMRVGSRLPSVVDIDDLRQAGAFGMIDAVESFDPTRGVKFQTFCAFRVRGAILDELRRMDWVPRQVRQRSARMNRSLQRLRMRLGDTPSDLEVAREIGIDVETYQSAMRAMPATQFRSLDASSDLASGRAVSRLDFMVDSAQPDPLAEVERADVMVQVAARLGGREQRLIQLYYVQGWTMKHIGRALGLAESRISQIHSSVLRRLRSCSGLDAA